MSTTVRWRLTLIALSTVCTGGVILTVLLAFGLADPPRVGTLQWQAESPDTIPALQSLPAAFTLEVGATNSGPADSAWGLRLVGIEEALVILIDNQGYLSVSSGDRPHWAEFPHIRPSTGNQLYLHVEPDGAATLRINQEIAWQGEMSAQSWGIVEHAQPVLNWHGIALYHE